MFLGKFLPLPVFTRSLSCFRVATAGPRSSSTPATEPYLYTLGLWLGYIMRSSSNVYDLVVKLRWRIASNGMITAPNATNPSIIKTKASYAGTYRAER